MLTEHAKAFLATHFHIYDPFTREGHEQAHWDEVTQTVKSILNAELHHHKGNDALSSEHFLLHRDAQTNQCTLYIRDISSTAGDDLHELVARIKQKHEQLPMKEFSITRLFNRQRHSYTACIQATSPEKLVEALSGYCSH